MPKKIKLFVWRLLLDQLPLRQNIYHKGINFNTMLCLICLNHTKDLNNLFLKCEVSAKTWNVISKWVDVTLLIQGSIILLMESLALKKKKNIVLEAIIDTT